MGAKEAKNTLRSRTTARVVDLLGEGEIEVIGGRQGVYLEKTQLEMANGKNNFQGVRVTFMTGTVGQSYIPGIRGTENEQNVGVQLKKATPFIRAVVDTSLDAVSVKVRVSALTFTDKKSGDIKGASVAVSVYRQNSVGGYVKIKTFNIKGKTTSAYERACRIPLPVGTGPWNIKVERDTNDSDNSYLRNDTYVTSFTLINDEKVTYPYSAVVGLEVDAQKFGSSFPERRYKARRINAPYPSNWNPTTRVYTGIWDGTFLTGTHDNPAWYLWELITSNRFGLGDIITAAGIDKWMLYTIAQYCDGMVPDGKGGQEPRFTFNGSVNSRQAGIKLLDAIASVFRGMIYWSAGAVSFAQDAPGVAAVQVTAANTLDGNFNRVSSADKARHTNVMIGWNNPKLLGDIDYTPVDRDDLIQRFGRRPKEVAAFGCTSEGQARRMGEWILDSEENENEVITWRASLDQIKVMPGTLVSVFDPAHQGARFAGRIMAIYRNLLTFAKDFSNAAWTKTNVTVTVNAATDQDGNLLADKIFETAVNSTHTLLQAKTCAQNDRVTAFYVAKAAERTRFCLSITDGTTNAVFAWFDLTAGTMYNAPVANAGWGTPVATIEALPNGYYRCIVSATKLDAVDLDVMSRFMIVDTGTNTSYLGVITNGILVSHAQLEIASAAGPIIEGQAVLIDSGVTVAAGITDNFNAMLPDNTLQSRAITKWEGVKNFELFPKDLTNAVWTKTNVTIAANADGTADKIQETAVVNNHYVYQAHTGYVIGQRFTKTVVAKAVERTKIALQISDNTATSTIVTFDLAAGTVGTPTNNAGWSGGVATISEAIDFPGYYKCVLSSTKANVDPDAYSSTLLLDGAGASTYLGVAGNGVLIAHSQFEVGTTVSDTLIDGTSATLLTLASPLSSDPVPGAIWSVTGASLSGELARVTGIFEKSPNVFEVQALKHDPAKYARVERNRIIDIPATTVIPTGQLGAPEQLDVSEYFIDNNGSFEPALLISWLMPSDPRVTGLEYQWTEDDGDFGDVVKINTTSIDLTSVSEGWFTFQVRSVAQFAVSSDWQVRRVYVVGANKKPGNVADLRCNVTGGNAVLRWTKNDDAITQTYEIRFDPAASPTWEGGTTVATNISKQTDHISTVARVGTYMIKAVTKNGVYSSAAGIVLNLVGVAPTNLSGVIDESVDWFGVNGAFNIMEPTKLFTDAAWIKTNVTAPLGVQIRETAVTAEHKFAQQFALQESDFFELDFNIVSALGSRNIRVRISDALGNFVQVDKDTTTNTTITQTSSGFTGITVTHIGGQTKIGAQTFDGSLYALVEYWALSGTTVSYLGNVANGFNFGPLHQLRTQNKTMIENGSGFLELATAGSGYRTNAFYEFANNLTPFAYDPSLSLTKKTNVKFRPQVEYTVPAGNLVLNDWLTLNDIEFLNGNTNGITITWQIRLTDNTSGIVVYGEWMDLTDALYTFKGAQFRFLVTSTNPELTPIITSAVINWEIPGYTEGAEGITSGAGNYDVVYAQEFYAVPSVQVLPTIAANNIIITNKTTTGFRVRFENAVPAAVSRVFDWAATGYGPVIP